MSFWVGLENAGPVKSFTEGGTYAIGGSTDPELNVTYNYSQHFWDTLGDGGLRSLDGKKAGEMIAPLDKAVKVLGTDPSDDYWEATPGNAGRALATLLSWARQYPKATFYVH